MNPATEIAIRWLLSSRGLEDELADGLVAALKAGTDLGEPDATDAVARLIEEARLEPKSPPYDEIVPLAVLLHDEMAETEKAADNLCRIREITRLSRSLPESEIGRRVVAARIRSLVGNLRG